MKRSPLFPQGQVLTKSELKKLKGGAQCMGNYCVGTGMSCTQVPLTPAVCEYLYPHVKGAVASCRMDCY